MKFCFFEESEEGGVDFVYDFPEGIWGHFFGCVYDFLLLSPELNYPF